MRIWISTTGLQRKKSVVGKGLLMVMFFLMSMAGVAVQGTEKDPPSLELLEFLGEWETETGRWVDPTQFKDVVLPDEEQEDEEKEREKERDS